MEKINHTGTANGPWKKPVIGIVGGMGPRAGVTLFEEIMAFTNASCDQDHHSVLLMSLPGEIVDRTKFLQGDSQENPAYSISGMIRHLENAGATVIGMACNTSYSAAILDVIVQQLKSSNSQVVLVNMPLETGTFIKVHYPRVKRVGVMTTNGTYRSRIYADLLSGLGFEVVLPSWTFQNEVIHELIYNTAYGIKSSSRNFAKEAKDLAAQAFTFFRSQGAEAVILGCTDLSAMIQDTTVDGMFVIDSTKVLAQALIREASAPVMPDRGAFSIS